MKITKHQPNNEGRITILHSVCLMNMGLKNDIPTVWAVTDPIGAQGQTIMLKVLKDNDNVTMEDAQHYISSFVSETSTWHLFAIGQKIVQADTNVNVGPPAANPTPPGPSGRIIPPR